jgi:hypothetical protein
VSILAHDTAIREVRVSMTFAVIPSVAPQPASCRNGEAIGGRTAKATTTT